MRCVTAQCSYACALSSEIRSSWTVSGLCRGSVASGCPPCGKKAAAFRDGWYRRRWCNGGCRGSERPRVPNTYAPALFSRITCVSPWFDVFAIKVQAVLMPYNTSNIGEWGSYLEYSGNCEPWVSAMFKKTADRMETEEVNQTEFFCGQKKACISGLTALTRLTTA